MRRFWLPILIIIVVAVLAIVLYVLFRPDAKFDRKVAETIGTQQYIRCFSGGKLILQDVSTGKVYSEIGSDGYYWTSAWDGHFYESNADCMFRSATRDEKNMIKNPTFVPPQTVVK